MAGDITQQLQDRVLAAWENSHPLCIRGGGTKDFYGRPSDGNILDTGEHRGVISYEPTELVITARAGTPLRNIEQVLADNRQMLAFEPPAFGEQATLGGTIACNLSGPRRAYAGAARDFVLGTKILNGKGELLHFGGEVMKNVAGYDVSRLMTGAMGTLGVMLEVSLKVLPLPETEITLLQSLEHDQALAKMHAWGRKALPISASCFHHGRLAIRLSGADNAVQAASQVIGGERLAEADTFWQSVREQQHDFFHANTLWRLSLASNSPALPLAGDYFYEWGGALRWLKTEAPATEVFAALQAVDGHASLFRSDASRQQVFQPLTSGLMALQRQLKQAFDPRGILNPGRMYQQL
jgi:glycolate oxidase FAD binding subunit